MKQMEKYMELYKLWSEDPYFDERTREELARIESDPKEIEERFYRELEFGTGGLRGIIGAGTNRMNVYTVSKVTAGLARYIKSKGKDATDQGVVISYDSRNFSPEFARIAAGTLAAEGVRVYLSDTLRPVPVLSFAVRHYSAYAGIMITASHNPPKYNGYKAYGEDGGQVTPEAATVILDYTDKIEDIRTIRPLPVDKAIADGLITMIGEELDTVYTAMLLELVIDRQSIFRNKDMSIVYTPLHGSGNLPVRRILDRVGFTNVHVVPEQELPNGDFPTVKVPNPEDPAAMAMGIELAKKIGAGIVIGTDPDSDRLGVAVLDQSTGNQEFKCLSGNQIGLLLLDYILGYKKSTNTLPDNSFAVTTIVSSRLAGVICEHYGVELQEVLTGFKFIGERIKIDDEDGDKHFQFGFEESYGYLSGLHVRDKDAIVSAMLISGMAAQSKEKGQTLIDRIEDLYKRFGYGFEEAVSFTLEGKEGVERIGRAMQSLRSEIESSDIQTASGMFDGLQVRAIRDYKTSKKYDFSSDHMAVSEILLPESDVILYELGGEKGLDWACVRPSGTEPKLKVYFGVYGKGKEAVLSTLSTIKSKVTGHVKERL
jgi:phosphoglucomutase